MRYEEVKRMIEKELTKKRAGLTWVELKQKLDLPYTTLCPEWIKQLEEDIKLVRIKDAGSRAHRWSLEG